MHTDNLCLMQVLGVSVLVVLCVRARRALSADACVCTHVLLCKARFSTYVQ